MSRRKNRSSNQRKRSGLRSRSLLNFEKLEDRRVLSAVNFAGSTLTFGAIAGEINTLTVSESAGVITLQDSSAPINPGTGSFTVVSPNEVTIPTTGITSIIVNLGDMNDSVDASAVTVASGITTMNLRGNAGNDVLVGSQVRDIFTESDGVDQYDGQSSPTGVFDVLGVAADADITVNNTTIVVGGESNSFTNLGDIGLVGGASDNTFDASAVTIASGLRTIGFNGMGGDDVLIGSQLRDSFSDSDGNDVYDGQSSPGSLNDAIFFEDDVDISLDDTTVTVGAFTNTYANLEDVSLRGGAGDNVIKASAVTAASGISFIRFDGKAGNDTLIGSQLRDVFAESAGIDSYDGQGHSSDQLTANTATDITMTNTTLIVDAEANTHSNIEFFSLSGNSGNNVFDASAVTYAIGTNSISINAREGDDTIRLGDPAVRFSMEGGSGYDILDLTAYATTPNLSNLIAGTIDGQKGNLEIVSFFDNIDQIDFPSLNEAPVITGVTADATMESKASPGDLVTLISTFTDADNGDTHTATIDWGDGMVSTGVVDSLNGIVVGDHVYSTGGIFEISVTVTDASGEFDSVKTNSVVTGARLTADGVLQIIGSDYRDVIHVYESGSTLYILARLGPGNDIYEQATVGDVASLQIVTCDGNDHIHISRHVEVSANIDSGAGHDWIKSGRGDDFINAGSGHDFVNAARGNDIVLGGAGHDYLIGGLGRDLMIGGTGRDILFGAGQDDILIGGTTDYGADESALLALLAEWASADSYATRINNIQTGAGALGGIKLDKGVTVHNDGEQDWLIGGSGLDWYFADLDGANGDDDWIW